MPRINAVSLATGFHRWMIAALIVAFCILASGMADASAPLGVKVKIDEERRAEEDRNIEAARDKIERANARLAAASAALRLDVPPRLRTRLWWSKVQDSEASIGIEAATRADQLASATFTDLLASKAPATDRLRAAATTIGATSRLLRSRLDNDAGPNWIKRLSDYEREVGDAADRTGDIDGPTLLILSAATLATDPSNTERAQELHRRASTTPEGIDAIEYEFIGELIKNPDRSGVSPAARIRATDRLLSKARPAADRLLLGAIQLQARLDAGESPSAAVDATRRATIPNRGMAATNRVLLLRGIANLAATATRDTDPDELPPLAAFGRLAPRVATSDSSTWQDPLVQTLVSRASSSTNPEIQAEVMLDVVTLALRAGDVQTTRKVLLDMLGTMPAHPKATAVGDLVVRLAEATDDDAIIRETTSRTLKALPDHSGRDGWLMSRAQRALLRGDRQEARSSWSSIPKSSDTFPEADLRLLSLDLPSMLDADTDPRMGDALERLDRIDARLPPGSSQALRIEVDIMRMQLLGRLGRISEASDIAARHLDIEAIPAPLRIALVEASAPALEKAGRRDVAAAMLSELERLQPGGSNTIATSMLRNVFQSTLEAIDRNDLDAARTIASKALVATPIDVDTLVTSTERDPSDLVGIAWLLAADRRQPDATRLVDSIIAKHPSAIEALYLQATILGGRLENQGRTRSVPSIENASRAIKDLRRISAGLGRGSRWWWRAEIEQLEILVALGRDLDSIEIRLDRLRKEFPNLGSPAFRRRVNALAPAITEARRRAG